MLYLGDCVTKEEDDVIKKQRRFRGYDFIHPGRVEWEGCGDPGPHKIHENERRVLLEYEGKG